MGTELVGPRAIVHRSNPHHSPDSPPSPESPTVRSVARPRDQSDLWVPQYMGFAEGSMGQCVGDAWKMLWPSFGVTPIETLLLPAKGFRL